MKIILKDVGYNRGYVIGPYLQERPGINADLVLEEGEDMEECALKALHYLKSIADKFHVQANPHMYKDDLVTPMTYTRQSVPEIQIGKGAMQPEDDIPEDVIAAIGRAVSIEEISTFKLLANGNVDIKEAYMGKLKEITETAKYKNKNK